MFGLRVRATVAWAVIALALAAGVSAIAYQVTRAELVNERRDRATAQAYLNARLVRTALRAVDPDLATVLSSLAGNSGSSGLLRVDGEWFVSSVGVSADAVPAELVEAVEAGQVARAVADVDGAAQVVVGVPIAEPAARYYEVVSLDDVDSTLDALARNLAYGATAATVAAAVAGWYASGRVLRPLRAMAGAASDVADGRLGTRLEPSRDPDLEPLVGSFNRMADAVQERIDREHRFTSDVSHELISPVAAMMSAISIARRRSGDPDALRDALDHLEERASSLQGLVGDLLEISRMDAGVADLQLDAVEPASIVAASLAHTGSDDVPVTVAPEVPDTVVVDKRRLGRCLISLLENAQKYAGGATRVEVTCVDGYVRFVVEDQGPGIPAHERRHVFGRFARGEQAREGSVRGTGLGLALVEEDVRLQGGRVAVEDAEGGGARFVVDLPEGVAP
jgi:signal transduction histidine kinase